MSTQCTITREWDGDRLVLRLEGTFERETAWALRGKLGREPAPEVLLDFSRVDDFSDLAVAVLAHGVHGLPRRVLFSGLRQHQLRIFRYSGIPIEEVGLRDAAVATFGATRAEHA